MLFVAAAGNNGLPNDLLPHYPASYAAPNVIAVAATTNTDTRASFSNYGAKTVHLGAPGVSILSTILNGQYGFSSGTSMATPHVSGAGALDAVALRAEHRELKDRAGRLGRSRAGDGDDDDFRRTAQRAQSAAFVLGAAGGATNLSAFAGDKQIRLTWSAARMRRPTA